MLCETKTFIMKKDNFIICPKCKNDKHFKLIADKLEPGIYEMKIGCNKCDWISSAIFEDTGYYPDMSTDMIEACVYDLHETQLNSKG